MIASEVSIVARRDENGLPLCACTYQPHEHGTVAMYGLHGCGCVLCTAANNTQFRQRRAAAALPMCDCPRATHWHGTRIMYNRHQCPCTPCGDANREYTQDYKRHAATDDLPVCKCPRVSSPHEHGTRGMYDKHRCRCIPCTKANRDHSRAHKRPVPPRHPMVDGDLVRARIAVLRSAGLTLEEIADMCGVNPAVVGYDVNGRDGRRPPAKVRASTLAALNAIRARDIAIVEKPQGRKLNGDIPRRQVQALYSFGWDALEIAERVGVHKVTINNLLRGLGTTERVRAGIDRLHAELHGTEPVQDTPSRKRNVTLARRRAAANGWTADTASDHEYAGNAMAA
jgi:transcriptional regulator with XRE-family HTH domain